MGGKMSIVLDEKFFSDDPSHVFGNGDNLILWFELDDEHYIAIDIIYDNYPPYSLSILHKSEIDNTRKRLLKEGWVEL